MNSMRTRKRGKRSSERGSVLAVSAFGMLAFLLAVGLGVDISHFYLVKTELQNAADAAALAGASQLNSYPSGITLATDHAVMVLNNYEFNHKNVQIPRSNVQFAVNLDGPYISEDEAKASAVVSNIRFLRVKTPDFPVKVFFASLVKDFGGSRNLSAEATAGMSVSVNIFCNWIPLTVITNDDDTELTPNNTYTIRSEPGGAVSPGNYHILAVEGSGGQDVETGIGGGVRLCKEPGDVYPVDTKPGITAGKVRKGINSRFDDYQGSQLDPAKYKPDTNVKENITYAQYRAAAEAAAKAKRGEGPPPSPEIWQPPTHPGEANRRIVVIPIVRQSEFDQGRNEVRFRRFGVFFLQAKVGNGSGGEIKAEYIGKTVVMGGNGYNPDGGLTTPELSTPVLYR